MTRILTALALILVGLPGCSNNGAPSTRDSSRRNQPLVFEISPDGAGAHHWRLLDRGGKEMVVSSSGFSDRKDCATLVESFKRDIGKYDFDVQEDRTGARFRLVDKTGYVLGTSKNIYKSKSEARVAVDDIKKNVKNAQLPPEESLAVKAQPLPPPPPAPVVKIEVAPVRKPLPLIAVNGIRSSNPQTSSEKALNDAIMVAQGELIKKLHALDPPVHAKPSLSRIRNEYLKRDSIREIRPEEKVKAEWISANLEPNRLWVDIDVEMTELQVKSLRSSERVSDGVRGAGLLLALVAAVYGFLRLDAWTKGYLTTWLVLGAGFLVVAAVLVTGWSFRF